MTSTGRELAWASAYPAAAHALVDALDDSCRVAGADGHHLARVRRLRAGEVVTASAGGRTWRPYRVVATDADVVHLAACGTPRTEPERAPRLAVAFAPTKGDRSERTVRQLTELGVDRILPVLARRSVIRWEGSRADAAVARLRRVAREAAQQCRRVSVPRVEPPTDLGALAEHPVVVVADREAPADALAPAAPAGEWLLLVGPEGGFAPGELDGLHVAGRVGVGPYVLRAETAIVAAASILTRERRRAVP